MEKINTQYYNRTKSIARKEGGNWLWGERASARGKWILLGFRTAVRNSEPDMPAIDTDVKVDSLSEQEVRAAKRAYAADAKRQAAFDHD
jgi:hypothetical protein